jgi:hypothetical protein
VTGNPYAPEVTRDRDNEPWETRAACAGTNPEQWFTYTANHDTQANLLGEKYCDGCPVRLQCAQMARETSATGIPFGAFGIWAGEPPIRRAFREELRDCGHDPARVSRGDAKCLDCRLAYEHARRDQPPRRYVPCPHGLGKKKCGACRAEYDRQRTTRATRARRAS